MSCSRLSPLGGGVHWCGEGVRLPSDPRSADRPCGKLRRPASRRPCNLSICCVPGDGHPAGTPPPLPAARHWSWWDRHTLRSVRADPLSLKENWPCVCIGLDVSAVTKLVVETVRETDDTEFTHHSQTLETGTTKVTTKVFTLDLISLMRSFQ